MEDSMIKSQNDYDKVLFTNLCHVYPTDCDIACHYIFDHNFQRQKDDKIALFKAAWASANEFIATEPAEVSQYVTFKAENLPKDTDNMYQLCYLSNNEVVGASSAFSFRNPDEKEIFSFEDPSDPDLVVFRSQFSFVQQNLDDAHKRNVELATENTKLKNEVSSYQQKLSESKTIISDLTNQVEAALAFKHSEIARGAAVTQDFLMLHREIRTLSNELETAKADYEAMRLSKEKLESSHMEVTINDMATFRAEMSAKKKTIKALMGNNQMLQRKLMDHTRLIDDCNFTIDQLALNMGLSNKPVFQESLKDAIWRTQMESPSYTYNDMVKLSQNLTENIKTYPQSNRSGFTNFEVPHFPAVVMMNVYKDADTFIKDLKAKEADIKAYIDANKTLEFKISQLAQEYEDIQKQYNPQAFEKSEQMNQTGTLLNSTGKVRHTPIISFYDDYEDITTMHDNFYGPTEYVVYNSVSSSSTQTKDIVPEVESVDKCQNCETLEVQLLSLEEHYEQCEAKLKSLYDIYTNAGTELVDWIIDYKRKAEKRIADLELVLQKEYGPEGDLMTFIQSGLENAAGLIWKKPKDKTIYDLSLEINFLKTNLKQKDEQILNFVTDNEEIQTSLKQRIEVLEYELSMMKKIKDKLEAEHKICIQDKAEGKVMQVMSPTSTMINLLPRPLHLSFPGKIRPFTSKLTPNIDNSSMSKIKKENEKMKSELNRMRSQMVGKIDINFTKELQDEIKSLKAEVARLTKYSFFDGFQ